MFENEKILEVRSSNDGECVILSCLWICCDAIIVTDRSIYQLATFSDKFDYLEIKEVGLYSKEQFPFVLKSFGDNTFSFREYYKTDLGTEYLIFNYADRFLWIWVDDNILEIDVMDSTPYDEHIELPIGQSKFLTWDSEDENYKIEFIYDM